MNYFDILLAKKLENDKDVSIVQLNVSENGTYSESGKAYSPVVVDVQPPPNSYLKTPIDSYPATAQQLPIPKCDVEIANQKSCKVFVSNKPFVNDKVPYLFRRSAGGDRVYEELIGGTIAWNQLVRNGNFADTSNWINTSGSTLTIANNEAVCVTTANDRGLMQPFSSSSPVYKSGHIYIVVADIKCTSSSVTIRLTDNVNFTYNNNVSVTSSYQKKAIIKAVTSTNVSTGSQQILFLINNATGTLSIKNAICIDITQMFGSTIADYIYSLEQTTAGAGVAWFRALFPNDYYAYDSGSLQSVNVASKKVYDSNNTLVATYAFDSDLTLRGIPKLDASNNLYYDGDVYESDGTVTRKYGVVDLGTVNWDKYNNSSKTYFRTSAQLPDAKKSDSPSTTHNLICSNYKEDSWSHVIDCNGYDGNICIGWNNNSYIGIYDSRYVDVSVSDFKTAMNGVYLVYELATPTTESADTYINPQMVDADGTEEFVDYAQSQGTRDVAVPVGHDSLYYNGQVYQTNFEQATTETINMAELHSIVPPSGEFYMASNGTLSVDVWKK